MHAQRQLLLLPPNPSRPFTILLAALLAIAVVIGSGCAAGGASTAPTAPAPGGGSPTPSTPSVTHSVTLNWASSTSVAVTGYFVYRRPANSATITLLNQAPTTSTNYVDLDVQAGQSLFYSVTAVDSAQTQSLPTPEVQVTVPN